MLNDTALASTNFAGMGSANLAFCGAALISFAWFLVHLFVGGKQVARPLLTSNQADLVLQTLYLCWHFTSAAIASMAILFALAAWSANTAYGVAGLILAAGFVLVGVSLVPLLGWRYAVVPQGWLFVPVAALALFGLWV